MLSDWKFFMQHINKSRRKKLARWIEDNTIEGGTRYLHLYGWSPKTKKAEDGGMSITIDGGITVTLALERDVLNISARG